jgi:hypothetical protein
MAMLQLQLALEMPRARATLVPETPLLVSLLPLVRRQLLLL